MKIGKIGDKSTVEVTKKKVKPDCPICTGPMDYKGKINNNGAKLYQCSFCRNVEIIYE